VTSLLAKSPRGHRELLLHQHLLDTERAASLLFRAGSRWATSYLRFFKMPASEHSRFQLNLRVAALFHDLGKANRGFQDAIRAHQFVSQPLRHEHLSALVLAHPAIEHWLRGNPALDQDVIIAAVLSHHLKAAQDGKWKVLASKSAAQIELFFDDAQITKTFARIATVAGLPDTPPRLPPTYQEADDLWADAFDALLELRAPRFGSALRKNPARRALCLAVKAGVIVADSVASATFREQLDLPAWIEEVAHASALDPNAVDREVLQPRIAEINEARPGEAFNYHPFQDGASAIGSRALLLAGCGAGKTMAAWRWADAVARSRPIGRVVFLYPTRGTATEGFRDYVGHAPEGTAALVHGTSRYELEGMQTNPVERPASLRDKDVSPDETEARLFALGLWPKRYFSATVDQFLSFMEHDYRGLCLLPVLADAAVIFDEVHSYDENMWSALVNFLREFDAPVLCMTATLPPKRQEDLSKLLRTYPDARERAELIDLEHAEGHPRYRLETVANEDAAFEAVVASSMPGVRILWVVNTVRRCQSLAVRLRERLSRDVVVYHSRYKLEDRQRRHRDTVDAFRAPSSGGPTEVIAVTTQVCEMSLDLDADILVTEHAPISSLVQRFGRANRHLRRGLQFRARLVTYAAESPLPYDRDDLAAAQRFLGAFGGSEVSQRDLAEGLLIHSPPGRLAGEASRFLHGGFFATPGDFRESDDSGTSVILDTEQTVFKELIARRCSTDGLRLPVPRKHAQPGPHPGLPTWLGLADGSRYSRRLGFIVDDDLRSFADHSAGT
jgi:CRISPR-associated endonuclease/helicase Cas3